MRSRLPERPGGILPLSVADLLDIENYNYPNFGLSLLKSSSFKTFLEYNIGPA